MDVSTWAASPASMRYEGSSGLSTPPESPTSTNNFRRFLPSRSPSIASQQSAKQPRLSRRAAFLRVNKPHIDLRLFDDSAYHSLPASPSLYSATPRTYEALPLILPLSPPLCAHDLFEKALAKSASCQTLGPKSAPKLQHPDADRYSLTSPSPVQFGEDFFSGARTTELGTTENKDSGTCSVSCDEMPLNSPLPEVLAMSLDHYHDSTDTALCHAIEESSDNRQNIRLSPGSFPPIDDDCEDLWDPAEMPITSGWIDDSSDEEDDAPDYEEERSAQRKWQIVQHSPDDNLPFEFESTEEAFRYATLLTTKKPRLITISPPDKVAVRLGDHVGVKISARPITPLQQYREVSAFSPETPKARPDSGIATSITSREGDSWGPVKEFWSRASSIDSIELPAVPPMFDAVEQSVPTEIPELQEVAPSSIALSRARQVLPPPILSPRSEDWRPSVSTVYQENTTSDLYLAVKAFPFETLCLSLSVITNLHSVSDAALLQPMKRIFPKASSFLLDSLAACMVARLWVKQYCEGLEQDAHALPKPPREPSFILNVIQTSTPETSQPSVRAAIPRKAWATLGMQNTNSSAASFSTALTSPTPLHAAETSLADGQSIELEQKLDGIIDKLLELLCGCDKEQSPIFETLKTSLEVTIESVVVQASI